MTELHDCGDIRGYIEDELIHGDRTGAAHVKSHLRDCPACQKYREELADLLPAANAVYSLPAHERTVFPAQVRTRISGRMPAAQDARSRGAVVQFAVMVAVVISVTLYLYYSGANTEFLAAGYNGYDGSLADPAYEYELLYGVIAVPDDELAHAAADAFMDGGAYAETYFTGANDYLPDIIDRFSAEDIETILQQLNGV